MLRHVRLHRRPRPPPLAAAPPGGWFARPEYRPESTSPKSRGPLVRPYPRPPNEIMIVPPTNAKIDAGSASSHLFSPFRHSAPPHDDGTFPVTTCRNEMAKRTTPPAVSTMPIRRSIAGSIAHHGAGPH